MRRFILSSLLGALVLVVVAGSVSASAPVRIIDSDDAEDCEEFIPEQVGVSGVTDDGATISLDILVLLDQAEGAVVAQLRAAADEREAAGDDLEAARLRAEAQAKFDEMVAEATDLLDAGKTSYAPLDIDYNFKRFGLLKPLDQNGEPRNRTVDAPSIIQLAKDQVGGVRPEGIDIVYVLTDLDMTAAGLGNIVAGLADCIGGVRYPNRAFGVGEIGESIPIGPLTFYYEATAKIGAHEIGHLMGAHHHYQDCVEGIPSELEAGEPSPCTLMTNAVDFQSLNFSLLEGAVVRGHASTYARP